MSQDKSRSKAQWIQSAFGNSSTVSATPRSAIKTQSSSESLRNVQQTNSSVPWVDKYSPKSVNGLAVHKKKVDQVYDWTEKATAANGPVFSLLKGPTGSGKSTTIKVIAGHLGINLKEWITPANVNSYYEDLDGNRKYENYRNESDQLRDFIIKGSRFPSVFATKPEKSMIMIEDWPSSFFRDPALWHSILMDYSELGKCPLVMIVGEDHSFNKLMPDHLLMRLKVEVIHFNSLAPTLLRKVLSEIAVKAAPPNFPAKDVIENICQASCGDLRSAINTLQFACLRGMSKTAVSACKGRLQSTPEKKKKKLESTQPKPSSKEINELANIGGRDAPDDFFHMISKALYAKRLENGDLKTNPDEIVEKVADRADMFTGFIQENYLEFYPDIQSALKCAENLELASRLAKKSFDHPFLTNVSLSIVTRGVMTTRKGVVKPSSFKAHRRPKYLDLEPKFNALNCDARNAFAVNTTSSQNLLTETLPYMSIISPQWLSPAQESVVNQIIMGENVWRKPMIPRRNGNDAKLSIDSTINDPSLCIEEIDSD